MGTINKLCVALGVLVAISISGCHFLEKEKLPQEKIAYERVLDYKGEQFKVTLTEVVWSAGNSEYDVQAWPKMPIPTLLVPAAHHGVYFHCYQDVSTQQWETIVYVGYPGGNDGKGVMERSQAGTWRNRGMAGPLSLEQVSAMTDFCSYALMNVRHPDYITARGRPAHS